MRRHFAAASGNDATMNKSIFTIIAVVMLAASANAQKVVDLRKTDFGNFTFKVSDESFRLKDGLQVGACSKPNEDGIPTGDIWNYTTGSAVFGDLDGDGREEAIVPLIANVCGGNMITNEAIIVLTAKGGKISQMPAFDYHDEGCEAGTPGCNFARNPGAGVSFDAATKAIVVETMFATDDDAICCPSLSRQTWFRWNGTKFTELKKGKITKREVEGQ